MKTEEEKPAKTVEPVSPPVPQPDKAPAPAPKEPSKPEKVPA